MPITSEVTMSPSLHFISGSKIYENLLCPLPQLKFCESAHEQKTSPRVMYAISRKYIIIKHDALEQVN